MDRSHSTATVSSGEFVNLSGIVRQSPPPSSVNFWTDFIAGYIGGTAGLAFGYPFDTIKVKQQTCLTAGPSSGILSMAAETLGTGGPRELFRGMMFPLIAEGMRNALFFGVYGYLLDLIGTSPAGSRVAGDLSETSYSRIAIAAGVAGGIQGVAATPVELVKVLLQSSNNANSRMTYSGPINCMLQVYKHHGVTGVFKGCQITVFREVPALATYMTTYHYIRTVYSRGRTGPSATEIYTPPIAVDLLAGGTAGAMSWFINMPVDVVKTRLQSDSLTRPRYSGMVDCFVKSYRSEGLTIFWRGLTITCIRSFPTNAVTLAVYSKSLQYLEQSRALNASQEYY